MVMPVDTMAMASLALSLSLLVAAWGVDPPPGAPGYVVSREERFALGARQDYVDGTRRWIALIRDSDVRLTFTTFGDSDGNVEFNVPVARLEDVGATLRAWAAAESQLGDAEWARRRQAALKWSRYSLWWQSPELTYRSPRPSAVDMPYFVWKNLRLHPAAEPAFLEAAARIRALFEVEPLDRALGVFRNISGADGPTYTVIIPGRDPGELAAWQQSIWTERRAQLQPLLDGLCLGIEEVTEGRGWTWPELSLKRK
jgi:hypothetical protein